MKVFIPYADESGGDDAPLVPYDNRVMRVVRITSLGDHKNAVSQIPRRSSTNHLNIISSQKSGMVTLRAREQLTFKLTGGAMNSHIVVVEDDVDQLANYSYALTKRVLRYLVMSLSMRFNTRFLGNRVSSFLIFI